MTSKIDFDKYLLPPEKILALQESIKEAREELDSIYQDYLVDRNIKRFKSRVLAFEKESEEIRKGNRR